MNDMVELETTDMKSNGASDLRRTHRVITRALEVSIKTTQQMMDDNENDERTMDGFLDYLRSLTSFIHAHHVTEDQVAFPMYRERSLDAPYDTLMKNHVKMQKILDELNLTIQNLASHRQDIAMTRKLHSLLRNLHAIWGPHIQIEESHFDETAINAHFTLDEQRQMGKQLTEHAMKNSGPDYLVVPFVVYNLSGKDRAIVQGSLPPVVANQLLPITWEGKWAPMKPFLLE
jgi:hemerythrin-like domain-containing protein